MKGVSVTKMNGHVVFVNVVDECGSQPVPYRVDLYVEKGFEPDYTTLPDEEDVKS